MPINRFKPAEWKEHRSVKRNDNFSNLNPQRLSWIDESNFPDKIGALSHTEHTEALRAMLQIARRSKNRAEFLTKFSGWLAKYPNYR